LFSLEIAEENFDRVVYTDSFNNIPSTKEKTLCSSLKNNVCTKKATFKKGHHDVEVIVKDDAGNVASKTFSFDVV
jgi:hypothetical protein